MNLKIVAIRQNTKYKKKKKKKRKKRKEKKRKEKNEKSSRIILAPKYNELYEKISNRTIGACLDE